MFALRLRSATAWLAVVVLTVGACAPTPTASLATTAPPNPTPSGSGSAPAPGATLAPDVLARYREIAAQVAAIRHLDAPSRVEPQIIDGATLVANLRAEFEKDNPPLEIAKSDQILKLFGLLGPGASLAQAYLDLQGSQVIGYYDPKVGELFIVSRDGALGAIEEVTYAHEFTHELQDRHFDLNSIGLDTIHDDSDRVLAILSLVEGDAVSAQTSWMLSNLTSAQLTEVASAASDPEMLAVLARTPRILLETSLFPYQAGGSFVGWLQGEDGFASVDAAYRALPTSTKQILHPDSYLRGEVPVEVSIPDGLSAQLGTGWTIAARDTFGEFQTRIWLREGGVAGEPARLAAEGWAGDRLALLRGPGEASALAWSSAWDTRADAVEFMEAARTAIGGYPLRATVQMSGSRVVIVIAPGSSVTESAMGTAATFLLGR
ncbi:MAG: hypothetical protein ABI598_02795 [Chloroflexota bacterium]